MHHTYPLRARAARALARLCSAPALLAWAIVLLATVAKAQGLTSYELADHYTREWLSLPFMALLWSALGVGMQNMIASPPPTLPSKSQFAVRIILAVCSVPASALLALTAAQYMAIEPDSRGINALCLTLGLTLQGLLPILIERFGQRLVVGGLDKVLQRLGL